MGEILLERAGILLALDLPVHEATTTQARVNNRNEVGKSKVQVTRLLSEMNSLIY